MPDVGHDPVASGGNPSPAAAPAAAKRGSALSRSRALWSRGSTNARSQAANAAAALDTARVRYNAFVAHPSTQRAAAVADKQAARARELLGRSETVRRAEALTGIDRLVLVAGGVLLFALLVPLNLLGLAHATTSALTLAYPAYKAFVAMERGAPNSDVHNLLAYFILLGYFQTLESLVLRFLVSVVPRYYLVKLGLMLYLFHPRTRGAAKVIDAICGSRCTRTNGLKDVPTSLLANHARKSSATPSSPATPGSPIPYAVPSAVRSPAPGNTATPVREGAPATTWGTHSPPSANDLLA